MDLKNIIPVELRADFVRIVSSSIGLEEIRLRVGQVTRIIVNNEEFILNKSIIITRSHIQECLDYISGYSLFAYENELSQGYITVEGGHRVGVAGKVVCEKKGVKTLKYIHSINIRVAHQLIGCANDCIEYIRKQKGIYNTLIISPPRCGKTTLLRDIIRQLSKGNNHYKGMNVGVVDERSEIAACFEGIPQNDLGPRVDILDGVSKAQGILMLLRAMSPQIIAIDELGGEKDVESLEYCITSGCGVLATVHGKTYEEILRNKYLGELIKSKRFKRYIILSNHNVTGQVQNVLDENGKTILI